MNAIISHLDTLAKRIRIAGVPAVFVTMPFFVSKSYRHDIIEAVNNWLRAQVAAGRSGFYLADADALEGQGKIPQDIGWLTDGVPSRAAGSLPGGKGSAAARSFNTRVCGQLL